jgi:hypothetical protein
MNAVGKLGSVDRKLPFEAASAPPDDPASRARVEVGIDMGSVGRDSSSACTGGHFHLWSPHAGDRWWAHRAVEVAICRVRVAEALVPARAITKSWLR